MMDELLNPVFEPGGTLVRLVDPYKKTTSWMLVSAEGEFKLTADRARQICAERGFPPPPEM